MEVDSDLYREVAEVYIRLIERDSLSAAASLRKIQNQAGTHAVFRAALIMTSLKIEIRQNRFLPNLKDYAYLFRDYQETVCLLEEAMADCLAAWGFPDVTVALDSGNSSEVID